MLLNRLPLDILPPRAILLAEDTILLSLPEESDSKQRFRPRRQPPYGTVAVQSKSGPHQIAVMRFSDYRAFPEDWALSFALDSDQDAGLADPFNTVLLGSDIAELADELDEPNHSGACLPSCSASAARRSALSSTIPDFASLPASSSLGLCIPDLRNRRADSDRNDVKMDGARRGVSNP